MEVHDADLDYLAEFLASDAAPAEAMDISELDGFLTGIAAAPAEAVPEAWLDFAFGDGDGRGEEDPRLVRAKEIALARYAQIREELAARPDAFAPILWADEEGEADPGPWARGFVEAMQFRPEAWQPAFEDDEGMVAITTILLAATGGELPEEVAVEDEAVLEELLAEAADLLGPCAVAIARVLRGGGAPANDTAPPG